MNDFLKKATVPVGEKPLTRKLIKASVVGGINFVEAINDIDYLRNLLGEVERRKFFAVMCLTPEKIARSSATKLTSIIKNLTDVTDDLSIKMRRIEHKLGSAANKSDNLTDAEKQRIDKYLNRK